MADFVKKDSKPVKNNGSYIFADFSYGLYLLDTPRSIVEQLTSLALIGGQNVFAEKGALIPQYGYVINAEMPDEEKIVAVTRDSKTNTSVLIITLLGNVYYYTPSQGLKKYKTKFDVISTDLVTARHGKNMIVYSDGSAKLFGGYYSEAEAVQLNADVPIADFTTYYELTIPKTSIDYYWIGKELCINDTDNMTVIAVITPQDDSDNIIVRTTIDGEHKVYSGNVTVSEKTLLPVDLNYQPEGEGEPGPIVPEIMDVCANRLFIATADGTVYYSQVGVIDGFSQALGAGYFRDFYNDTSKILSIEDFLNGALIVKQDGIYHAKISNASSSSVALNSNPLTIQKISQIGQEYATDHVIVREQVYAYDSNSGSIVLAAYSNVFGSLVAGKTIVSSEYLNARNAGIFNTKRVLTYNAEAEVFILYYGEDLTNGIVLTKVGSLFPRKLDIPIDQFIGFNQGVLGISNDGRLLQDFKRNTIIPNVVPVADFEAIGLRDNRLTISSILEVTELNGIEYIVSTNNADSSYQKIQPYTNVGVDKVVLPPLIYSDRSIDAIYPSYELETKWAEKKANVTRIYAPMSGRSGVSISIQFPANEAFCLCALRLPDFSQGE